MLWSKHISSFIWQTQNSNFSLRRFDSRASHLLRDSHFYFCLSLFLSLAVDTLIAWSHRRYCVCDTLSCASHTHDTDCVRKQQESKIDRKQKKKEKNRETNDGRELAKHARGRSPVLWVSFGFCLTCGHWTVCVLCSVYSQHTNSNKRALDQHAGTHKKYHNIKTKYIVCWPDVHTSHLIVCWLYVCVLSMGLWASYIFILIERIYKKKESQREGER